MNTKFSILILGILLVMSCGKSDTPLPEMKIEDPVSAALIFPENNTECNEGTIISSTQSKVHFQWNESEHTDSYEVILENLDSNVISNFETADNEKEITIERGISYKWQVISKSAETDITVSSEIWKFYNAGEGLVNHAPFPAEVISPTIGSEVTLVSDQVDLKWQAIDIDNDIIGYKVFLGTNNPPANDIGTTSDTEINATVISGSTYYWYIETEDNSNNRSTSDIFTFKVK